MTARQEEPGGAPPNGEWLALTVRGDLTEAEGLSRWVGDAAERLGIAARLTFALRLCAEELVANAILHGHPSAGAAMTIKIGICPGPPSLRLIVEDDGRPFDPTGFIATPPATNIADAAVGGHGLTLVRHFSASLSHTRRDGGNRTEITFSET